MFEYILNSKKVLVSEMNDEVFIEDNNISDALKYTSIVYASVGLLIFSYSLIRSYLK